MNHYEHGRTNRVIGGGHITVNGEKVNNLTVEMKEEMPDLFSYTSFWAPSEEEKAAIMRGQGITITCLGVQPPLKVGVDGVDE